MILRNKADIELLKASTEKALHRQGIRPRPRSHRETLGRHSPEAQLGFSVCRKLCIPWHFFYFSFPPPQLYYPLLALQVTLLIN